MSQHFVGPKAVATFIARGFVVAILGFAGTQPTIRACTTPVYRYAMYNWASSPFVVCYLHRGEPDAKDEPVHKMLREASKNESATANVVLEPIDLDQWKPEKLPPPVREALKAHSEGPLPIHVVLSPWGVELSASRLDEAAVAAMVSSPMRTRLGELLDQGNAAVLLLIPGKDEVENTRVKEAIRETIAQAASGQIPVASIDPGVPPMPGAATDEAAEDALAAASRLELATATLARTDPAEKWLLESLMKIEPDLHEYRDEPMVFAVYGRGRSMEPYIGKGVTVENLCQLVAFLAGACSCMVKEQNPGVDLLFQWDWESTADRMAADDPTLTPTGFGYQEMPAEPSGAAVDAAGNTESAETMKSSEPAVSEAASKPSEEGVVAPASVTTAEQTAPAAVSAAERTSATPVAVADTGSGATPLFRRQMWTLGAGALVAAVAVLAAGFVVLRRRTQE
ncbi:MAG: hypothetical protein GXY83_19310 [Rhodopirellula sp.]|nr:hypothetical protein [Rhodopirellula sp.]